MRKTHFRACHLCEAICGLVIETDADHIVSIRGDDADPLSHGHICPKAVALKDVHEDQDRLRRPLRRTAKGFVEVGWDEAIAEAAERLTSVQRVHGRERRGGLPGQPDRAQLRGPALRPGAAPEPRHAQPFLGHLGRPASADARLHAHVRAPAAPARARRRPHAVPAHAGRQSPGFERQPHDRPRHREAARGAPRARRPARGGRSTANRHRGARRPAPRDSAGNRRAPARGPPAHARGRGQAAAGTPARVHGRPRRGGRGSEGLRAGDGGRTHRRGSGCHPRPGPRLRPVPGRRGLRPGRRLHPGVRRPLRLAHQRAERGHRQPRPGGRRHVHPARRGHRGPGQPPRPTRPLRQGPEPRARPARVRRRVAGRRPGRGDRDARAGADPRPRHAMPATPCSRRPTGPASIARWPASTTWSRSTSTGTRRRATRTSSCPPSSASSRTTTTSCSTPWPCATPRATRGRSSPSPGSAPRLRDSRGPGDRDRQGPRRRPWAPPQGRSPAADRSAGHRSLAPAQRALRRRALARSAVDSRCGGSSPHLTASTWGRSLPAFPPGSPRRAGGSAWLRRASSTT